MTLDVEEIEKIGGKLKVDKLGRKIIAFGSCEIEQHAVKYLSKQQEIIGILFYYCNFKEVDLSILAKNKLTEISVLHGNFGEKELMQMSSISSLEVLKLYDLNISKEALEVFKLKLPNVELI